MGPMVPPQMAFLKRWPWRSRWRGPSLSILNEIIFRAERRKLRDLEVAPVEPVRVRRDPHRPGEH